MRRFPYLLMVSLTTTDNIYDVHWMFRTIVPRKKRRYRIEIQRLMRPHSSRRQIKKSLLLQKFPFELRLCNIDPATGGGTEEVPFLFAFNIAVRKLVSTRNEAFNISTLWHEKVTIKVNFPMSGFDMSQ